MLDAFLSVAYDKNHRHQENVKLSHVLQELSVEELKGLAEGTMKLAFAECSPVRGECWIDKYKGTPLFDLALALERAELEAEVARTEAMAAAPPWDAMNKTQDGIRVQKKMLDLELLESENGVARGVSQPMSVVPNTPVPPPTMEDVEEAAPPAEKPSVDKEPKAGPDMKELGQKMAMAKAALDMKALGGAALGAVKKNPKALGAAIGAAGGAVAAGPDHRLSGALGGAAVGAGAGGVAQRVGAGQALGKAVSNTGRAALNSGMRGANRAANLLPARASGHITNAVQGANQLGHDAITALGG